MSNSPWRNWLRPLPINTVLFVLLLVVLNTAARHALPENPLTRADLWLSVRQFQQAAAELLPLAEAYPTDVDIQYRYLDAVSEILQNDALLAARQAVYQEMLASEDQRDIGYWGLGWTAYQRGQADQAVTYFDQVSDRRMKYLNLGTGLVYLELNEYDQARVALRQEIAAGGAQALAARPLVALLVRQDRMEEVGNLLDKYPQAQEWAALSDLRRYAVSMGAPDLYRWAWITKPLQQMDPVAVAAALFIAVTWFFYFWRIDIFEQEPVVQGVLMLAIGVLMAFVSVPLGDAVRLIYPLELSGDQVSDLIYNIVYIGMLEELLKFLPVLVFIRFSRQVNEPIDVMIYGSLSALGFATLENIAMISQYGERIMIARLLIATVMHIVSTGVVAYAWAHARFIRKRSFWTFGVLGWFGAGIVHGIFNFLVLSNEQRLSVLSLLVLILSVWGYSMMLRNALNFSPFFAAPLLAENRLVNYEWILSAGLWLLAIGYLYFHVTHATPVANRWIMANIWTTLPTLLGIFAALGELGLKKGRLVFP